MSNNNTETTRKRLDWRASYHISFTTAQTKRGENECLNNKIYDNQNFRECQHVNSGNISNIGAAQIRHSSHWMRELFRTSFHFFATVFRSVLTYTFCSHPPTNYGRHTPSIHFKLLRLCSICQRSNRTKMSRHQNSPDILSRWLWKRLRSSKPWRNSPSLKYRWVNELSVLSIVWRWAQRCGARIIYFIRCERLIIQPPIRTGDVYVPYNV